MWGDGEWHLYNITRDPGETTRIEADMPEKLDKLVATYERYVEERNVVPVDEEWNPWGRN